MVFTSNIFLFCFLPVFLGCYYVTPFRYRSWIILAGSYLFYAWWRVDFVLLFAGVTAWNYWIGCRLGASSPGSRRATRWIIAGVVGDVLVLGYFKYANFGVTSLNMALATLGMGPLAMAHVILPIGISFYIFQAISYLVDVYRGDTEPTRRIIDFFSFIALFPQLIAGPILRYKDLASQFENRTHSLEKFSFGVFRFMQGFAKKVIIADSIAPLADHCFTLGHPSMADSWVGILAYTVQLYFDFSGYSDMAIGLGLMMGFTFVENFNQPYISRSVSEFWRRWHISLSVWLRDYLYIPLGGNRGTAGATMRNLLVTMLLGGLWHGANWTFLLWGGWHGCWMAAERGFGWHRLHGFQPLHWMRTLLIVVLGWVLFRADSVASAWRLYRAMFGFSSLGFSPVYQEGITRLQLTALVLAVGIMTIGGCGVLLQNREYRWVGTRRLLRYSTCIAMVPIFYLAVLKLSAQSYSPFLYFQF